MEDTKRIQRSLLKATEEEIELIQKASKLIGLPVGTFIRNASIEKSRKILTNYSLNQGSS